MITIRKLKLMELVGKFLILMSIFIQVAITSISNYSQSEYGAARIEALLYEMHRTVLKICDQVKEHDHPAWYDCYKLKTVDLLDKLGVFDDEEQLLPREQRAELSQRAWEVEMLSDQQTATWLLYLSGVFLLIGSGLILWAEVGRFRREQTAEAGE